MGIDYKKSSLDTYCYALSTLKSLQNATVPLDENISVYPGDVTIPRERAALVSDSDVTDYSLLTNKNRQDPLRTLVIIGR